MELSRLREVLRIAGLQKFRKFPNNGPLRHVVLLKRPAQCRANRKPA